MANTNLELGNNNATITVINTFTFAWCWMLWREVVVKSRIRKQSEIMCG